MKNGHTVTPLDVISRFGQMDGFKATAAANGCKGTWEVRCPCHDDNRASLTIAHSFSGKLLIKCHAGCDYKDIMAAISMPLTALHPPSKPKRGKGKVKVAYDYRDRSGKLVFQVCRMEPKDFRQRQPDGKGGWIWNMKGVTRVLYRLPELLASTADIYLVEGEKDVDRLSHVGLIATTCPGGAGKWKDAYSQTLKGRNVIILPDNDDAGRKHAEAVADAIHRVVESVKVVELPGLPEKGDFSDWANVKNAEGELTNTLEGLIELVEKCEPWKPTGTNPCRREINDPHLLAEKFLEQQPTILFWRGDLWRYTGTHYRVVLKDEARAEINSAVEAIFMDEHLTKGTEKKMATAATVSQTLEAVCAKALVSSELEQPCWIGDESKPPGFYIAMQNGILNVDAALADPNAPLIPHTSDWFSPVCLPYAYDPAASINRWLDVLTTSLVEADKIELAQEWFGYCLTPDTSQQKMLICEGEGSNGKSVVCAALTAMLGSPNVSSIPLESFGGRFALHPTVGKLANIVAECGEIDRVAEGHLKAFTSGDMMTIDRKNQSAIQVVPTARFVLATNNRPRFSDKSGGLWRRMLLLSFEHTVRAADRIIGMDKSLWWEAAGELPAIFNWALEGLRRLRERGEFTTPKSMREAIRDYRADLNPARAFLEQEYRYSDNPHDRVLCPVAYRRYQEWCEANGYRHPMCASAFGKEVTRVFPVKRARQLRHAGERVRAWFHLTETPGDEFPPSEGFQ